MAGLGGEGRGPRDPAVRLGHILIELGCLGHDQVETVLRQQAQQPRRFGDLAVALGLVARSDIDLALARQFDVDFLPAGEAAAPAEPLAGALPPPEPRQAEVLRAVRSQLLLRWFGDDPEQRTLAVLSAQGGQGRTHVCAQLGRLLAQLDEDTLLVDADLRKPGLHQALGMANGTGLGNYLRREVVRAPIRAVPGVDRLHLLSAGTSGPEAQALVERREFGLLLGQLARRYAFVLIDTPPAGAHSEALTAAVRASGSLLVTRLHRTRVADMARLSEQLKRHGVEVIGALLNER
jgi:receptor protein-tyrosine kinase